MMKQYALMTELNHKNITFEQFVGAEWELMSEHWCIYSPEVVELAEEISSSLGVEVLGLLRRHRWWWMKGT